MKVILLNYPYLQNELNWLGVEVFSAGLKADCDNTFSLEDYSVNNILKTAPFDPDLLIYMDSIERIIPSGLGDSPVPLAAYFIDSTINNFWQRPFAHLFDLVLTDQKRDAELLKSDGIDAHWFPLAADTDIYSSRSVPKIHDITFVGSRNPRTRVKRENILKLLDRHFRLSVFSGDPYLSAEETAAVYNRSRLVLNENLFPSVNLRLFEAMACGTAVLTEDNDSGVNNLFRDGVNLVTYNPDNLVVKVEKLLGDNENREEIAKAGGLLISERHSTHARAEELSDLLNQLCLKSNTGNRERTGGRDISRWKRLAKLGEALLFFSIKWQKRDPSALIRARQCLEKSLEINPSFDALLTMGMLYSFIGEHSAAELCFREATKLDLEDFRGSLYRAESLKTLGKDKDAEQLCRVAKRLAQSDYNAQLICDNIEEDFHLFWGNHLRKTGEAFSPGLMRFNLPLQFWTGLEHLKRAAELSPRNWELVGDLLMECQAPVEAAHAYRNGGVHVGEGKVLDARRRGYDV